MRGLPLRGNPSPPDVAPALCRGSEFVHSLYHGPNSVARKRHSGRRALLYNGFTAAPAASGNRSRSPSQLMMDCMHRPLETTGLYSSVNWISSRQWGAYSRLGWEQSGARWVPHIGSGSKPHASRAGRDGHAPLSSVLKDILPAGLLIWSERSQGNRAVPGVAATHCFENVELVSRMVVDVAILAETFT